MKLNYSNMFRC